VEVYIVRLDSDPTYKNPSKQNMGIGKTPIVNEQPNNDFPTSFSPLPVVPE
jgi:hypothetical protein